MADDTFHIGLTMAGAISAGAYTAGVLDVLFDALDRHNARFEQGRAADWQGEFAAHPRHKVALRVISGTSAGGVSAGLAVAGPAGARSDEDAPGASQIGPKPDGSFASTAAGYHYGYQFILKPLHHVWFEALDLYRNEGSAETGFLSTGDLRERPVDSALNSEHIDDAAKAALAGFSWNGKPYRFLTQDVDLFLTTTNLEGVPRLPGSARSAARAQAEAARSCRGAGGPAGRRARRRARDPRLSGRSGCAGAHLAHALARWRLGLEVQRHGGDGPDLERLRPLERFPTGTA